jgi:hypothetical protein
VNQHATTEKAKFSVKAAPRLYISQAAERIEGVSGNGGWQMMEELSSGVPCEQLVES